MKLFWNPSTCTQLGSEVQDTKGERSKAEKPTCYCKKEDISSLHEINVGCSHSVIIDDDMRILSNLERLPFPTDPLDSDCFVTTSVPVVSAPRLVLLRKECIFGITMVTDA